MPFTLVHAEKVKNTDNTETKHKLEKVNNAKHSKTKLPWLVAFYDTGPENEVGLLYNPLESTWGTKSSEIAT